MRAAVAGTRGVTLVELLIAILVVAIIAIGFGSLYVSSQRALDLSSAEAFLQRQGTLIQEELQRQVSRANLLEVAECRPTGVTLSAGESIIYNRRVQDPATSTMTDEASCVFRHQPSGQPAALWRCPIPGTTPPQTCSTTAENLLFGIPQKAGRQVDVSVISGVPTFQTASILCGGVGCATVTTVDVRFRLNLATSPGGQALIPVARDFGFNLSLRN
jgi:prepilin-type N-terminal cleavage/methylation domain-containing protein